MSQTLRAHVDLPVDGMTCAACASRIERGLNGIEGVEASVNSPSNGRPWTTTRRACRRDDLVAAVEAAGYAAHLPGRRGRAAPTTGSGSAWSSPRCWRSR